MMNKTSEHSSNVRPNLLRKVAPLALAVGLGMTACTAQNQAPATRQAGRAIETPAKPTGQVLRDAIATFDLRGGKLAPYQDPFLQGLYGGEVAVPVPGANQKIELEIVAAGAKPTISDIREARTAVIDKITGTEVFSESINTQSTAGTFGYLSRALVHYSPGASTYAEADAFDKNKTACAEVHTPDMRPGGCKPAADASDYAQIHNATANQMEEFMGALCDPKGILDVMRYALPNVNEHLWKPAGAAHGPEDLVRNLTAAQEGVVS